MFGLSIWHIVILLVIGFLLFGGRLSDLMGAAGKSLDRAADGFVRLAGGGGDIGRNGTDSWPRTFGCRAGWKEKRPPLRRGSHAGFGGLPLSLVQHRA